MKVRIGDEVIVTAGKDKGKVGKVEKLVLKKNAVVVGGVNLYKRHVKARGQNKPGGIIDIVKPLPVANIAVLCPKCKKQTRIGYQIDRSGEKLRKCLKCKAIIETKKEKK
ncbi:MAG TPA: 50S ribosomal protein L24 [Patescibacteria group bacterium]|nr:50S ribosomal protein L24 [Patescibacteria group bacterium]